MNKLYIDCGYFVCRHISNALREKQNSVVLDVKDPDVLYSFCQRHKLTTILGSVISDKSTGCERISEDAKLLALRQLKRGTESDNISTQFKAQSIPHIVQKGTTLAKFYPDYIVRDSADIDIYVQSKFVESAGKVLTLNGYSLEKLNNDNEFCYHKHPRYCVELHTKLSGFNEKQKTIFNSIAEKTLNSGNSIMNDSDNYICTLFHLYKHLTFSGAGVRMFLDIYMMKRNALLDEVYVKSTLSELGISDFEQAVCEINAVLFEGKDATDDIKAVIEFIFESGIYGTADNHNHLNQINNSATDVNKRQKFAAENGISFSAMSKRYPILKKAPVLYPFSFVHRFFYGIINRRKSLTDARKLKNSISRDKISKYKKIFDTLHINTD